MKVKFYLAMVVAALMMTNCSQEESMIQSKGSTNVLTATIEGVSSRSSVTDGGVFSWDKDDAIAVGNSDNRFTKFVYGENGKFSAEEAITPAGYAIYPHNEAYASYTEGTLPAITLKDEYTYGSTNAPMLAVVGEGSNTLSFKHLAGLMRFRVKNVPAETTTFTLSAGDKKITGEFSPVTENSETCINTTAAEGNDNEIKIIFEEVKDVMDFDFYVPMPVGEYEELTVTIGGKSLSSSANVTNVITRGKLLLMPTMTFDEVGNLVLEGGNNVSLKADEEVELDVNDGEKVVVEITEGTVATLNLTAPEGSTEGLTISDGSEEGTESLETSVGTLNVSATNAATLNINTPTLTVKLLEGTYDKVEALTAQQTLIIGEGVTIGELVLNGGNVKLEGNLTIGKPLAINIATTIDLNGYTLSYESDVQGEAMITNKGNLTIIDSSTDKNGEISFIYAGNPDTNYGKGNYTIVNYGTLTINAGTISVIAKDKSAYEKYSHALYVLQNVGTLTVNGGKIYNPNNTAVRLWTGSETVASTLNLNGGEIEGLRAVWIQLPSSDASKAPLANVNVTNGTLTSWANNDDRKVDSGNKLAIYSYSAGNSMKNVMIEISGGTFNGDVALTGGNNKELIETLNISGGTFNGLWGDVYSYGDLAKAAEAITITGGTFSNPSVMDYLGANANVTVNMTESYEGSGFVTKSGQTVYLKMASDVTYKVTSPLVGSEGTKTLGFQFLNGSTVSIEGGKITSEEAKMLINNYTNLTLKDVELAPTIPNTMNGQKYYVLSNNSGNVILEGKTSITAPTKDGINSFAFDVCKYSTYNAPVVTVNTTGIINGLVEVSGGTLNVEAGTFKNEKGHCFQVINGTANFQGGNFTAQEVAVFNLAGNVYIEGGTFTSNDNAVISGNGTNADKYKNGNIVITGGTFNAKIKSTGYVACGIYHPQAGTLKVTGGTFNIENGCGILMRGGKLDMTGGNASFKFTGNVTEPGQVGDSRVVVPCGKMIVKDSHSNYYDAENIKIEGVDDSSIHVVTNN